MSRTQVYLSDEELTLLDGAKRATGASRSELIRRAIHSTYGRPKRPWPRSIGIASSDGGLNAADAKEWVHREWDRKWGLSP